MPEIGLVERVDLIVAAVLQFFDDPEVAADVVDQHIETAERPVNLEHQVRDVIALAHVSLDH